MKMKVCVVYEDKEFEYAKKHKEEIGEMKGVFIPSRRPNVREKVEKMWLHDRHVSNRWQLS